MPNYTASQAWDKVRYQWSFGNPNEPDSWRVYDISSVPDPSPGLFTKDDLSTSIITFRRTFIDRFTVRITSPDFPGWSKTYERPY